jgi:asparagine synthase (glutamine-hydrolysing)
VAALDGLLRQSLEGQMVADVPLGAFLSGGIDSSTVVATMQSMSTRPIRTFTIGFHQPDYNEAIHAKDVARHLGTDHTELYVTEQEAMDVIPKLPEIYCEPFSDSSQIPTYLVSKLARQSVTVSLSGDAGDELFSGYTRYGIADDVWNKLSRVPGPLRRAAAGLATLPSPAVYDRLAGPLMQLLPERQRRSRIGDRVHKAASLLSLKTSGDVYLRLCSHWSNPAEIVIGGSEMPTMLTGYEPLPSLSGNVEQMMYTDLVSYLPDDILVKVDRAAMAVSLETRVPFLDHRIVEFAMSLPLSILRAENSPKWPLRQILYKHVPREMIERPKMGFGVPIDTWLRGALRDWAEDLLSEHRLKSGGYFDPAPIRRVWQEHLSGRRNHQYLLWDVLMFQAWNVAQQDQSTALAA